MALDRRKIRYGSNATIAVLAGVGICVVLNAISDRRFKRWDWTGSKIYSLSDKTIKTLQNLKADVDVTVLMVPAEEVYDEVHEVLSNYRSRSPRIKLQFLDPQKEPARAGQILQRSGLDPHGVTTGVAFTSGDHHKYVSAKDLIDYDFSEAGMGGTPRVKGFKGESAFTSALLSVTESKQKAIYFLKGHNEVALDDGGPRGLSRFSEALKRENVKVETTDVLGRGPLPADCDLLVIAGPVRGFSPPEAQALGSYIDSGGHVLALLDPPFSREGTLQSLGIETVFLERGIGVGNDIVLDPSQRLLFGTAESFAASDFPSHPITKDLTNTFIVLGLARSAAPVQPPPSGWTVSPLARTSDKGWGERDLVQLDAVAKGADDLQGPVSFAAAAEKKIEGDKTARIVLVGDSDLAQNQFLGVYANLDFLLNAVNWLAGTEEQIGIAAREPEQVHLAMTGGQERTVMLVTLLGMPGMAILGGIVVWLFRRR